MKHLLALVTILLIAPLAALDAADTPRSAEKPNFIVINIDDLLAAFETVVESGQLQEVMEEIVVQSKVEFNYGDDDAVCADGPLDES